jgi:hypothetical protein
MFGIMLINGEEEKTSRNEKCVASLEPPLDANGDANKNGHFLVHGAMKTDALDGEIEMAVL